MSAEPRRAAAFLRRAAAFLCRVASSAFNTRAAQLYPLPPDGARVSLSRQHTVTPAEGAPHTSSPVKRRAPTLPNRAFQEKAMSTPGYRVFISYSRANGDRKKRLVTHLSTLKAEGLVSVWHDGMIEAGARWREELDRAMREAEVALFLVSAEFIESPFCQDVEVPEMLRRHREEGVLIVPVIVDYCNWEHVERISQFQALPEGGKPVPSLRPQSKAWTQVVAGLRQRLTDKPPAKRLPAVAVVPESVKRPPELSLASLLREMPGESGDLFGREKALGWLDDAYADSEVGVLALVGFGGVGKSALVRHWLETRFKPEDRAPRFFGVSFYSQGTREQAGSSDQFLVKALETFGETDVVQKLKSAWDRGERLAELVAAEPTVLVLDGLEPLQHGPGPHDLEGRLKDPGVHALLARLAARPGKSLCLVSTRVGLKDEDLQTPSLVQKSVEVLSSEAARELFRSRGVRGDEEEVGEAVEYLGRHPLALVLAAEYLHTFADGDVTHLHEINLLSEKTKEGRHAKSVMAAYETALQRDGDPLDLELLGLIGLFDRPTRWDWLKALAAPPSIEGVTEHLARASDRELRESINRLRQWGMLADPGSLETPDLDAHPLVREYFGEKLRRTNEPGWREAHSRMFDYLTSNTKEFPDTLEEMEPLYQAVAHGCAAGRHQEALEEVYWPRISRGRDIYSIKMLGAISAVLGTLTSFFSSPWEQPISTFSEHAKGFILAATGFVLQALGRSAEASRPMQASLEVIILQEDWENAAQAANNLSELYLTTGDLSQALTYAERSMGLADRSGDSFHQLDKRTALADVLYHAGRLSESEALIRRAEEIQKARDNRTHLLYSLPGFRYCALLLHQGKYLEVQIRAVQTLEWVKQYNRSLLDIALDSLSLGRSYLLQARREATSDFLHATEYLNQAVSVLRQAGHQGYLSFGLLARAELRRVKGEFDRARDDVDEAMLIASRGSMKLYQADCHLEYARLYVAEGEREKAREHLGTAKEMIERMEYHLRDEEVGELERELGEKADG
jgi:tetratricopeptide (TPR) repeat protein